MNKIGGKFFSPEWFDLDREGKMMEDPNKTPQVDDLPEIEGEWQYDTCDICGESLLEYMGERYDEDEHLGSTYKCANCGHFQHFDDDEY